MDDSGGDSERWPPSRDGYVPIDRYRLFYRSFGEPGPRGTVLGLHGGPGATHEYLLPWTDLTRFGYRVVLFDQLGCGDSDLPTGTERFTLEENVREVEAVRSTLGLGKVHVMGSSYGGTLALAYALAHPQSVRSLVITGGLANFPLATREMQRLIDEMPAEFRDALRAHEAKGEFTHPEYLRSQEEFYHRHVLRHKEWPTEVVRSFARMSVPVYHTMNGPNEFTIVGTLKDLDFTDKLHAIRAPTMFTVGRYDEVTPTVARSMHEQVKGSRLVVFENSSHLGFWEERPRYIELVHQFLDSVPP